MEKPARPHRSCKKLVLAIGVIVVVLAIVVLATRGPAYHQVINAGETCAECHSDRSEATGTDGAADAQAVSTTLTVDTSASNVVVCRPHYTGDSKVPYVPERVRSVSVSDGKAQVTLDAGTWVLVTTADGSDTEVKASKLVTASADGSGETEISL